MIKLPRGLPERARRGVHLAKTALKVGTKTINGRIAEARLPDDSSPQDDDDFVAAAYFSSETDSVYQLEQWLWPFERLAECLVDSGYSHAPFGIFVRSANVARRVRPLTSLPVRFSRLSKGLDAFMAAPSLRVVFYVNQATGNFQALQFPRPAHVHLSHGESEKVSMISNQLKAYDFVFTAGKAARERIGHTLIGYSDDRMLDVGRPQLDRPRAVPQDWQEFEASTPSGPTVFYAPTWEGDSPAMSYGTLEGNGAEIASALLDDGYRVIFRSHPRTGSLRSEFGHALESVQRIVEDHPRGFIDSTPEVSWQFEAADIALAEMSSVAFDWLATHKPLVMIAPFDPGAEVLAGGLLDRCPRLDPGDESRVAQLLRVASLEWASDQSEIISTDYLGHTEPGQQIARFIAASEQVIAKRDCEILKRMNV